MPVTIKSAHMKYKNGQGEYVGVNSVSDNATSEQIAAIEAAGEDVLESIPSDYTALSNQVDDLKGALDEVNSSVGSHIRDTFSTITAELIPITTTNYNIWLKKDGGGESHSGYCLSRYAVTPGDLLYIDIGDSESPGTYVYKNSNSADNTNNVSQVYTLDGMVASTVPAGASPLRRHS